MGRWEPDARGRLEKAAMELFVDRGYARTTVGDIAERAGLTERTFFRHFTDKREVLFSGSKDLEANIVGAVEGAAKDVAPLEVVVRALEVAADGLQKHRELAFVRARYAIVLEHAEVQERELIKMASLAAAASRALRARGVTEPTASLVAETGMAIFKVGFFRWVHAKRPGDLAAHIRGAAETLAVAAADVPRAAASPGRARR